MNWEELKRVVILARIVLEKLLLLIKPASCELSFCLFLFWLFEVKIIGDMRLGHGIARQKLNDNVKSVWPGDG